MQRRRNPTSRTSSLHVAIPCSELLLLAALSLLAGCWQSAPPIPQATSQSCQLDTNREALRAISASQVATPTIDTVRVNGEIAWSPRSTAAPTLHPGDEITLEGSGFGSGPDIDFSKIMIGNSRVLETDLKMYEQRLDIATQLNYETSTVRSAWDKDILSWADTRIVFRVPVHASRGPLVVQVQKRTGFRKSLGGTDANLVTDATAERITDPAVNHACDVVSTLGKTACSTPIFVVVENPAFDEMVARGRQAFWSYDYNLGTAHSVRNLDWEKILGGEATDPMTGDAADPTVLFGAYPAVRGEVPDEAIDDVYFDPYPQRSPIPGFLALQPALSKGNTRNSGYVGYRYAESNHPLKGLGEWIGFNCASCHGQRITYEPAPGVSVTRVFPGLPNALWSMKWTLLGDFEGIHAAEQAPGSDAPAEFVDKTALIYSMPQGTAEHTIVRRLGDGHETDNDDQFSPIAIPNVTYHMPIRRPLSHTESYVGFEGSYIHAEAPDGATGTMDAEWLQALTAYMTTLDEYDDDLRNVGLYRWLKSKGLLVSQAGDITEGAFVQSTWQSFPGVAAVVDRGKTIFNRDCASCHHDGLGTHTDENMIRLDEVGRFFAPTVYHRQMQAIRTSYLRNLYWVQLRGLLSDGHVRNLEDLVDPDRCTEGTALYNQYYTLHAPANPPLGGPDHPEPYPAYNRRGDVFRVPRSPSTSPDDEGAQRNRFIERHRYFVTVPWDPDFYYWDYQKMRREYGPAELGTQAPIGMPAAPHPWCASDRDEILDLVEYLLTL